MMPRTTLLYHGLVAVVVAVCVPAVHAATTFFPATPYLQRGDAQGLFDAAWPVSIEDFEDNAVDPFLTELTGSILPPNFQTGVSSLTDSVDGDDGAVDGVGNDGYSFFNSGRSIRVTFDSPVTSAGLVWTDGDPNGAGVTLEAFDSKGMSLGVYDYGDLADGAITGQTAEDRFIGASSPDGISALLVTNMPNGTGIEIDHVHWQVCEVPEPASVGLMLSGLVALAAIRRRR